MRGVLQCHKQSSSKMEFIHRNGCGFILLQCLERWPTKYHPVACKPQRVACCLCVFQFPHCPCGEQEAKGERAGEGEADLLAGGESQSVRLSNHKVALKTSPTFLDKPECPKRPEVCKPHIIFGPKTLMFLNLIRRKKWCSKACKQIYWDPIKIAILSSFMLGEHSTGDHPSWNSQCSILATVFIGKI